MGFSPSGVGGPPHAAGRDDECGNCPSRTSRCYAEASRRAFVRELAAARAPGVTSAVGLLNTAVLVPVSGSLESATAQGVAGSVRELAAVQDLDVRHGALSLKPGEVAMDASLADSAHAEVGDRLALRLPDGTEVSPTLVATYGRGLGLSQATFARADLARHVTDSFDSEIWMKGGTAAGLSGLGRVRDRADHTTAESRARALNAWANTVMAARWCR
ncbi:hypothetical protein [Streptomyces mirabilis]|uniref:hypothetical protein n=1 Tax=Streptomyces mirabilis TaxID=68239 RepID=UPI0015A574B6|nr:hypothetical protein [Streptomyces mirabilis]